MENDIRWIRRFSNFIIALEQLRKAVAQKEYTELEEQGVIQCFEYTYGIRSLHSLMSSPCVWNRSEWQENYERASLCALDCKMSISHQ